MITRWLGYFDCVMKEIFIDGKTGYIWSLLTIVGFKDARDYILLALKTIVPARQNQKLKTKITSLIIFY